MKPAQWKKRLKIVAILVAGLSFSTSSFGQSHSSALRDGQAQRGGQLPSPATRGGSQFKLPPTKRAPVQQASATSRSPQSQVAPVRVAQVPTSLTQAGGTRGAAAHSKHVSQAPPSSVEQAGCKDCQAGGGHVSAPVHVAPYASAPVFDDYSPVGNPDSYRFGSSCDDACGPTPCGPTPCAQPLGLLGTLLAYSQIRVEGATFWGDAQAMNNPLVTTRRPANDPATDGLIGRSDTTNLFGGKEMLSDSVQGIRGEIGLFLDPCRSRGLMLRMFDASMNSETYNSTNSFEAVVMRPFFSTADNAQSTIAINYPDSASGSIYASLDSEVYGGDILMRRTLHQEAMGKFEFLAGYQMMRLDEGLSIVSSTTALDNGSAPLGTVSVLEDHFTTSNRFNGAALGLNAAFRDRCWSFTALGKLGLGNVDRKVNIHGRSEFSVPGNPPSNFSTNDGLLARSSNNGDYSSSRFVVAPELALTLGYRFTPGLEATLGYTFLTLPKVARVGDQLDPQLASNISAPPTGAVTPRYNLTESNYSLHSLSYGVQWRY